MSADASDTADMDPWGGSGGVSGAGSEAPEGVSALGFEDNFTDASNGSGEKGETIVEPSTENLSIPRLPASLNFIPRIEKLDAPAVNGSSHPSSSASTLPSLPPLKDPLTQMMSSEEYISRLETKLKRIKGGGGGGAGGGKKSISSSAKQMFDAFSMAKETNDVHTVYGNDTSSDSSRMELNPNMLFQRAFPERTPLTMEELEWLVNHDQLRLPDDGDEIEIENETS